MTEPVLIKRSFLIALMAFVQTMTPPLIAVASLYVVKRLWNFSTDHEHASGLVTLTLLFVVLIRPPRTLSSQLNWQPLAGAASTVLQWLLLLAVLALVGYATNVLGEYPRRALETWALVTPVLLVLGNLTVRYVMRRLVMSAVTSRKVVIAGYNNSSLDLARRLASDPALRLEVVGFFDLLANGDHTVGL